MQIVSGVTRTSPFVSDKAFKQQQRTLHIDVIIPIYNEADNIVDLIESSACELLLEPITFRFVIVDDGSEDKPWTRIATACSKMDAKYIKFSRNFGKEAAITAGLRECNGDACIIMDGDGQHDPVYFHKFIAQWKKGNEMVVGVRESRADQSNIRSLLSNLYYRLLSGANSKVPKNQGDFRLISRKVIDQINLMPEKSRMMKGIYNWGGFKTSTVKIDIRERKSGTSKFNYFNLFELGLTGLTAFSVKPLRAMFYFGAFLSIVSLLYSLVLAVKTLVFGIELPGWSTLSVGLFFIGGINFLFIGLLGEYVGQIYKEVKARPDYIIEAIEEIHDERI